MGSQLTSNAQGFALVTHLHTARILSLIQKLIRPSVHVFCESKYQKTTENYIYPPKRNNHLPILRHAKKPSTHFIATNNAAQKIPSKNTRNMFHFFEHTRHFPVLNLCMQKVTLNVTHFGIHIKLPRFPYPYNIVYVCARSSTVNNIKLSRVYKLLYS